MSSVGGMGANLTPYDDSNDPTDPNSKDYDPAYVAALEAQQVEAKKDAGKDAIPVVNAQPSQADLSVDDAKKNSFMRTNELDEQSKKLRKFDRASRGIGRTKSIG